MSAQLDTSVMHLLVAEFLNKHHLNNIHHVYQALVEQMQFAENKMALVLVYVFKIILEIPTKIVALNVFLTLTVHRIEHVFEINVAIHVPELVDKVQYVKLLIICHLVLVFLVIPAIHSDTVILNLYNVSGPSILSTNN